MGFRKTAGLQARLLWLLSLALLPLGLISLYQTYNVLEESSALRLAGFKDQTIAIANAESALVQEALGAAHGLGGFVQLIEPDDCSENLARFVAENSPYLFAGYIRTDGILSCASDGAGRDFSGFAGFEKSIRRTTPNVQVNQSGEITGKAVLIASHPILKDGKADGIVSISLPYELISGHSQLNKVYPGFQTVTFNAAGDVLFSSESRGGGEIHIPEAMPTGDLFDQAGSTFRAKSVLGEWRLFTFSDVIAESYIILGNMPDDTALRPTWHFQNLLTLVTPFLMWLGGILVAGYGLQRLVLRHVRDLRFAMSRFAKGDRGSHQLRLIDPPEEFLDTADAFNIMAHTITDNERVKDNNIHEKEVLLKEVHHRVKNNLQLIASIMNMQSRQARTGEARRMIAGLQRRVRGLATLHGTLNMGDNAAIVNASQIIDLVVRDVKEVVRKKGLIIKTDLASVPLYPDQAVPLSMLVSEALTNAVKYAGQNTDGQAVVTVCVVQLSDGRLRMNITNTKGPALTEKQDNETEIGGLGAKLMAAFVSQLEGTAEVIETESDYTYRLEFTVAGFET